MLFFFYFQYLHVDFDVLQLNKRRDYDKVG